MSLTHIKTRLGDDRGSAVSVLILFMAAFMFVQLVIFGGRLAGAKADVAAAAREGARSGSYALSGSDAHNKGVMKATTFLLNRGNQCQLPSFSSDTSNFAPRGSFTFTARCTVDLSDLTALPVSIPLMSIDYTATEVIEQYRVVGP